MDGWLLPISVCGAMIACALGLAFLEQSCDEGRLESMRERGCVETGRERFTNSYKTLRVQREYKCPDGLEWFTP